jgi:hypothetical protein
MSASVSNIIIGAAQVFLSVATTQDGSAAADLPALSASTSARTTLAADINWADVGYTTEGVELMYEPEYGEVQVDQLLDAAVLFKQAMKISVRTTFAEATLANLFIVVNQPGGFSGTYPEQTLELLGGSLGEYPVERSLVFVGPGPRPGAGDASERVYYTARAMSIESSSFGLKRQEATVFPVSFRLLPLASTSNAYGRIIDRVVT